MKYVWLIPLVSLLSSSLFAQQAAPLKTMNNTQLSASVADIEVSIKSIKKDLKRASKLLDNKVMLDLFQRLDDVSQDVSELRGQVEEQGHLQQNLQKRQRELYLDLDRRLREMELNASQQTKVVEPIRVPTIEAVVVPNVKQTSDHKPTETDGKPVTPVISAPLKPVIKTPEVKKPEVKKQVVNRPIVKTPKQPMSKERAEYQKAFDLLKEGRYNNAKVSFKAFLLKYPTSSYAGNAQYWSGEANYVTRQFATAMQDFKRVITQYPASNKVPDAMLKLGYTFYETRQMNNAKQILSELIKRYPKSTAARLANKRMKRMQREGL